MDRLLIGDNQFFGVNHTSDEKGRQNAIRFSDTREIMKVLDYAYELGITTFVCSTHSRISEICDIIRANPAKYVDYKVYPTIPDVHKYANALGDLGIVGTLREYSEVLKKYQPGDKADVEFERDGKTFVTKIELKSK